MLFIQRHILLMSAAFFVNFSHCLWNPAMSFDSFEIHEVDFSNFKFLWNSKYRKSNLDKIKIKR